MLQINLCNHKYMRVYIAIHKHVAGVGVDRYMKQDGEQALSMWPTTTPHSGLQLPLNS